jgi:hypothetical protein
MAEDNGGVTTKTLPTVGLLPEAVNDEGADGHQRVATLN